jgi:hypothetical protein
MGLSRRGDDRRPKRERPVSSVKQQGNGGSKRSPEAVSRMESALESERRQRELLERRLLDTERRLEAALAAVQAPAPNDAALLLLKSTLMAEMEAAEYRAQLETELLALELVANAEAEAFATPAAPLPPQRVIQYIHVPAPEVAEAAPAPQAVAAPKDFDDKLAAAQMAIDAAEARASHNAVQVRKLTEELAAARAEQIRLSAEVRQLAERFGVDIPAPSALRRAPVESPAPAPSLLLEPLAEVTPVEEPAPAASSHDDMMEDLATALADWGAPEVVEAPAAASEEGDSLEDALASFGDSAPVQSAVESTPEASGLDLEEALQAWGDGALESATLDTPEPAADAAPVDDALAAVLEGWGEETPAPAAVEAAEDYTSLLEVDTLARLDTQELPAEERIAAALGEEMFGGVAETRADELLEDLESSVVLEEEHRWEPTPAPVDEDEMETIGAWSVLSPEDRLDAAPPEDEAILSEEEEPEIAVPEVELPEAAAVETLLADAEPEPEAVIEEAHPAPRSRAIAVLEEAEAQRREILAARNAAPAKELEAEAEAAQDFQPDLTTLVKRGAASRSTQQPAAAKGGRDAMIDALQQFIGE